MKPVYRVRRRPPYNKPMSDNNAVPVADLSFEQALQELDQLVRQMESGELSLDDSIAAYRRGAELAQHCQVGWHQVSQPDREGESAGRGREGEPVTAAQLGSCHQPIPIPILKG